MKPMRYTRAILDALRTGGRKTARQISNIIKTRTPSEIVSDLRILESEGEVVSYQSKNNQYSKEWEVKR